MPDRAARNLSAEIDALLGLHLACRVGGRRVLRLLAAFESAGAALDAAERLLAEVVEPAVAARIARTDWRAAAASERRRLKALDGALLTWNSPEYPELLRQIPDPPPVLHVHGLLRPADSRAIAVVGARAASLYGRSAARALGRGLARAGITVVSGLARGIDEEAHRAALEAGGRSMAVLGTGPDRIYPPEHRELADRLAGSGAVLSEFSTGTPPLPSNFPVRNRIIAGLALGCVVVEAAARSGALITARLALEYGRSVFAVPGGIGSRLSAGPHGLIRDGAMLVQSADDVLAAMGWSLPPIDPAPAGGGPAAGTPAVELLSALQPPGEPVTIDELCERVRRAPAEVLPLLFALESTGAVLRAPGMRFLRPL